MSEQYLKMDLHIHTPVSKCYTGQKDDEEYIRILEKAKENQVAIIAITDHNTITGYEKMLEMRNQIQNEINVLKKFESDNVDISREIEKLNKKISLFENIKILLGVELTINPGVHIIVIARDEEITSMNTLLSQLGYTDDDKGKDNTCVSIYDVKGFLELPILKGKLVIAPHVDSDNGIYNVLKGNYRAHIFKSDILNGISCNNPEQLKSIKSIIINQKEYRRNATLGYINASDAHNSIDVGKKVSYIKAPCTTFDDIFNSFLNPEQTISDTKDPQFATVIKEIIGAGKIILLENEDVDLAKAICACLNNNFGRILIGISNSNQSLNGIMKTQEDINNLMSKSIKEVNSENRKLDCKIYMESLGNGRRVYIIRITCDDSKIWYMSSEKLAYIFDKHNSFKPASISELENLIRFKILKDIKKIDEKNCYAIDKAISSINCLKDSISKYELDYNLTNGVPLWSLVNVEYVDADKPADYWNNIKYNGLGLPEGNVYLIDCYEPRLKDAYLRCTCPCISITDEVELTSLKKYTGTAIVISSGGGTHIISKNEWYLRAKEDALIVTLKDENLHVPISLYSLIGWLKSSALIWAINWKNNSSNIFIPNIFNSIYIPNITELHKNEKVHVLVESIIEKEIRFLEDFNQQIGDVDEINLIDAHNNLIIAFAREIDCCINSALKLSDTHLNILCRDLEFYNIFNYIDTSKSLVST